MADELKDQRIPIMMSPSEVKAIDDWMFANRVKSRSKAIRALIAMGLNYSPLAGSVLSASALLKRYASGETPPSVEFSDYADLLGELSTGLMKSSEALRAIDQEGSKD